MAEAPQNQKNSLKVLSANVRGLRTNIGDLMKNFVERHDIDIVVATETWLDEHVEPTFGKTHGYSQWMRNDRSGRPGGGVAVSLKEGLQAEVLREESVPGIESIFFRVALMAGEGLLVCALYRPTRQGPAVFHFMANNLDHIMTKHNCNRVMIIGDLNHHLERTAYESLLAVQGLEDLVTFPTHVRGGSLDPVITDLQEGTVECRPLQPVGSSDHYAVLTQIKTTASRDEIISRTNWLWAQADWTAMRQELHQTNWDTLLTTEPDKQATTFTSVILDLQNRHVPHRIYTKKSTDRPWFGYHCRLAAKSKHSAWVRYKRNPTPRNKDLHRAACRHMRTTSKWAQARWEADLKTKLRGPGVGSKTWWTLVKERQGAVNEETIPPLKNPDGTTSTGSREKADIFADLFATKMMVRHPERPPPRLTPECDQTVTSVEITRGHVEQLLRATDTRKATGPDNVSPHVLKKCAHELSGPLTMIFNACLRENKWPTIWKEARVVPVHKKNSRSDPQNYRPISLLSVVGKVFERILAQTITEHLDDNGLLSHKQFGFRHFRSTSDLLLLLTKVWQDSLDNGLDTIVVALDIAGAFDRVWHEGLIEKLRAKGIQGSLLSLLSNYLHDRTLKVVVNGQSSRSLPINASVPQGSVLGPILWNIYIDDLLHLLPEVSAYADDCTLTKSYHRQDSQHAVEATNQQLRLIKEWGERWQVDFSQEKTQVMVVSRSPAATQAVDGQLQFGDTALSIEDHIKILGVDVDKELRFNQHIKKVAHLASLRVSALRRVAKFLDRRGLLLLYKAQIRPYLEYATLSWMSAAPTHLQRLNTVERRALRLIEGSDHPPTPLDSLEHRRDVASLVVLHKAQVQQVPHLDKLRINPQVVNRNTRTVSSSDELVEVLRSHSSQHLRTFTSRVSRLWNKFTAATPEVTTLSTQEVKVAAHRWRATLPTPLVLLYA